MQKKYLKFSLIGLAGVALYALLGFIAAPYMVKRVLEEQVFNDKPAVLKTANVAINPFVLSLEINKLQLADPAGQLLAEVDRIYINLQASGLFKGMWLLHEVLIEEANINLTLLAGKQTNFSALMPADSAGGETPVFLLEHFKLSQGKLTVRNAVTGTALAQVFENIDVRLNKLGTQESVIGDYYLSLNKDDGASLSLRGQLDLNALSSKGELTLSALSLAGPASWLATEPAFMPQGSLALSSDFSISVKNDDVQVALDNSRVALANLRLLLAELPELIVDSLELQFAATGSLDKGLQGFSLNGLQSQLKNLRLVDVQSERQLAGIASLASTGGSVNGQRQEIETGSVHIKGTQLNLRRGQDGLIDWSVYLQKALANRPQSSSEVVETEAAPDWVVVLKQLEATGGSINFEDASLPEPGRQRIEELDFSVSGLRTDQSESSDFNLNAILNGSGHLQLTGRMLPEAAGLDADITLTDIELPAFAAYLQQFSLLSLQGGQLSAKASVEQRGEKLKALADVKVKTIAFTREADELVRAELVSANEVSLTLFPLVLRIKEIDLEKPYINVGIDEQRRLNVSEWMVEKGKADVEAASENAQSASAAADIVIGKISINDASIDFSDASMTPQLETRLDTLQGGISKLDFSGAQGPAALIIAGRVGEYGQVDINGELYVFEPGKQSALKVLLQNLDTALLSPYAGRFAGRRIKSGKLDLDLDYLVKGGQINGNNLVLLKDFVLGERVESADALDLPLDMALALLKDKNGRIDISVPISGDLNNPKFDIGAVISKAISNTMSKLVTAPFKALGSIFGNKTAINDSVPFAPGRQGISPPAAEMLAALGKALLERPAIALKIIAGYEATRDREALARKAVRRQVLLSTGAAGTSEAVAAPMAFDDTSVQAALEQLASVALDELAFATINETADKATSTGDAVPGDYYHALFEALVSRQQVSDEELLQLARSRAQGIEAELIQHGIDVGRIAIAEPVKLKPSRAKNVLIKLEILPDRNKI